MGSNLDSADDLAFASAAAQGHLIRARELSPVELTDVYLDRIDEYNGSLNAYITVVAEQARAAALKAERDVRAGNYLGPLHGIPYGLKDQVLTAGIRTTAGSPLLGTFVPAFNATVVERMEASGAILIGKHNLDEWGKGGTERYPFGEPRNPWNLDHIASGSSSGSGAATAAGLCSGAIGEDTGGSVRQPAAANGVVGLRPTFGRVSRFGTLMFGWNMDCLGPITRTVEDAAIFFSAMAGYDPRDALTVRDEPQALRSQSGNLSGRRLGVVSELLSSPSMSPDVHRAFREAIKVLESLGASVEEISLPLSQHGVTLVMLTTDVDVATAFLHQWLRTHWFEFDRGIRRRLAVGALVPAATYNMAMRGRVLVRSEVLRALRQFDALLSPTNPGVAPRIDARADQIDPSGEAGRARRLCTYPFSIANTPAISVPCGMSHDGLPIGLQIAGRPLDEQTVFEVARAYEMATRWHLNHPVLTKLPKSAPEHPSFATGSVAARGPIPPATLRRARAMAEAVGLPIPEEDLPEVAARLEALLADMAEVERQLGSRLDAVEPVPPVFPWLQ